MKTTLTPIFVALALTIQAHAYLSVPNGALNARHFHMVERGETGEIVGRSFSNTFDIVERNELDTLERRSCTTINACGTAGGCMVMAGQRYCTGVPWQKSFQDAVKQTGANGVTGLKLMAEGIGRGPVGMLAGVAKATAKAIIDAKKTTKKTSQKSAKRIATKSPKRTAKKTPKKTAKKSVKHAAKKNVKHSAKRSVKHSPKKSTQRNARKSVKHSPKKSVKPSPKKSVKPSPKRSVKPSTNKGGKKKRELADENDILNRRDFEIVARDEDFSLVERGEYSTFDLVVRNEDGSLNVRQCEMYNGDTSCQ